MPKTSPILAISARTFRSQLFGEQTSYLRGILRIARKKGMRGYVFSPGDIDWTRLQVKGWTPAGSRWRRSWFPLPDVVYERAWGLGPKKQRELSETLDQLAQRGIPHFNPDFGDKVDVYDLLASSGELAPHLPETLPLTPENLAALGEKHPELYIKPARGRQGKGIFKCRRLPGGWRMERAGKKGRVVGGSMSPEAVVAFIETQGNGRYLAQQGLALLRLARGSVDVRVIVQRDRRGEWGVSAVGVRAGRPGSLVSNLHAGGKALPLSALRKKARLTHSTSHLKKRIARVALLAAEVLTRSYPTLGELGIDLGLDKEGHIWLLEVNRQPGRALFARARLWRAWRRSRARVVEFARHLATSPQAGLPRPDTR